MSAEFDANEDTLDAFPTNIQRGMTLRDWFAGQTLVGMNATLGEAVSWPSAEMAASMAISAYLQADAMLKELAK